VFRPFPTPIVGPKQLIRGAESVTYSNTKLMKGIVYEDQ
jgi:hypothetical protein